MKYKRFKKSVVDTLSGVEIPMPEKIYWNEALDSKLEYGGSGIDVRGQVRLTWAMGGGGACYVRSEWADGVTRKYYRFTNRYEFECWLLGTFYGIEWPEVMRHPKFGECTMSRWLRIGGDYYRINPEKRRKTQNAPAGAWF